MSSQLMNQLKLGMGPCFYVPLALLTIPFVGAFAVCMNFLGVFVGLADLDLGRPVVGAHPQKGQVVHQAVKRDGPLVVVGRGRPAAAYVRACVRVSVLCN